MKDFSDIHQEEMLDGEKLDIEDIFNKKIVVLAYGIRKSRYENCKDGIYTIIQFMLNDEKKVIFSESSVLRDQLNKHKEHLPFTAKIIKVGRYHTFVGTDTDTKEVKNENLLSC